MDTLRVNYIHPLTALAEGFAWKTALASTAVCVGEVLLRVLAIPIDFLALMILLIIGDTITGMLAAKRRGEIISSRAMRRTVSKATEYFIFVLLAVAISNVLGSAGIPLVSAAILHLGPLTAAYICLTELRSIAENVGMGDWMKRLQELVEEYRLRS